MKSTTKLIGYVDPLVLSAGGHASLNVSSNDPKIRACDIEVLRTICADPSPHGPGQEFEPMPWGRQEDVPVSHQRVNAGSYAVVDHALPLASGQSFTLEALVWPTAVGRGRGPQTVLSWWSPQSRSGFILRIDTADRLEFVLARSRGAATRVGLPDGLQERRWYCVSAAFDVEAGEAHVHAHMLTPVVSVEARQDVTESVAGWAAPEKGTPFIIAALQSQQSARPETTEHYNGKIERLRVFSDSRSNEVVAAWDFARETESPKIVDTGPHALDGRTVNLPMRGVTGSAWDGSSESWRHDPTLYNAIHFHDDDLYDCEWCTTYRLAIPDDARSGYYVARQSVGDDVESYVPFFVSASGNARAKAVLIAPTATYLSYANTHIKFDSLNTENLFESIMPLSEDELYLNEHRELGLSHYDTHSDDSGVVYVSSRRPMLNMRPGLYTFNYLNDTHILAWLERQGFDYDVITDEDLHHHGIAALCAYTVVLTASHPEYYSTAMWDTVNEYQNTGGRHMYLGGNGFYWRIAYSDHFPGAIENRRGTAGVRTWEGEPGEHHLSFTGEPGGLWRANGRSPQSLVGVGFCATLFANSVGYVRTKASYRPEYQFIFEDVDERTIGDFGYRGSGAAGLEIDRFDESLGSPPDAVVLATTEGIGPGGLLTGEEFITTTRALDGTQNAKVRADMVYFRTPNGGAVWSTGSIAWATSLCWNNADNSVSRITANVLRRFLESEPLS